jgi:hypothetical protein
METKQMLLNDHRVTEEMRGEIKKIKLRWKHTLPERLGHSKCSTKREVYGYECLHWQNQRDPK